MPKYSITFQTITEESAAEGDYAETGFVSENVELDEDEDPVEQIVNLMKYDGYTEPSSSFFHTELWYTWPDGQQDYKTGEVRYQSIHLDGFTEAQEKEIYCQIVRKGERAVLEGE